MIPMAATPHTQPQSLGKSLSGATLNLRRRIGLTREQIAARPFSLQVWNAVVRQHPLVLRTDLFPEETELLLGCFEAARPQTYLEVGVFWGGTFKNILAHRDALGLSTKCIGLDVWDEVLDAANTTHTSGWPNRGIVNNALLKCGFKNFELLSGLSTQAGSLINGKIDFALHDANHTYAAVVEDLNELHPLLTDGATMVVHNAGKEYEPDKTYFQTDGGPYQAIMDLVKAGKWELKTLEYRVAVLKKIP
jgi:cephalosporin hydroxylase